MHLIDVPSSPVTVGMSGRGRGEVVRSIFLHTEVDAAGASTIRGAGRLVRALSWIEATVLQQVLTSSVDELVLWILADELFPMALEREPVGQSHGSLLMLGIVKVASEHFVTRLSELQVLHGA